MVAKDAYVKIVAHALLLRLKQAVAALVVSFFPMYPQHTKDGRYHLQAFRHL